jgi:DMSO/TMAO reductase YedYZ molybdopterin-dependent catalytic subunit
VRRGPFDRAVWTSPLRGPWLASALSVGLLALFGADLVTGYLSAVAYQPALGQNDLFGGGLDRHLLGWTWPTHPAWLYGATQGVHVVAGAMAVPVLAAKLWAVMPKLYKVPPVRSPAEALERGSLGLLVGSSIFLLVSGLWDIAYWYAGLGFNFVTAHYYAAWVFAGSFAAHVVLKMPVIVRAFRDRGVLRPLRDDLHGTHPEPYAPDTSAPLAPGPPTVTRRGALALAGGAAVAVGALLVGEGFGGGARATALLAPRGRQSEPGPGGFPVNKTARAVGVGPEHTGPGWRLEVRGGPRTLSFSRADLLAMAQATHELPINCVEGWSTLQTWTGVPLRDLARRAGVPAPATALVESLQPRPSAYARVTLGGSQAGDPRTLIALRVNGADLPLDHGFPARLIVPDGPGVHNTKWVERVTFA